MTESHGFIGADQVRRLKAAVQLPDLVGQHSAVKRAGKDFVALCPFHQERSPSFTMFEGDGGWQYFCHGCGVKGDVLQFLKDKEGLEFHDACEHLAKVAGITLQYERSAVKRTGPDRLRLKEAMEAAVVFYVEQLASEYGREARQYLLGRGFTASTLATWRIGWAPGSGQLVARLRSLGFTDAEMIGAGLAVDRDGRLTDVFWQRLTIPMAEASGAPVAFAARMLPADEARAKEQGKPAPKYINTAATEIFDKSRLLFGLDRARVGIREQSQAILVEGQLDVIAAHQLGLTTAVASCGTALTEHHVERLRLLLDGGSLCLRLDQDAAGQQATERALALLWPVGLTVTVGQLAGAKDLGEIVQQGLTVESAVKSGVPADRWLIARVFNAVPIDQLDRLPLVDQVLALVLSHCDPTWRDVVIDRLSTAAALPVVKVRARAKYRQGQEEEAEAPVAVKVPAGGEGDAGEERDRGFHRAVILSLQGYLMRNGVEPDAIGGWLRAGTDAAVHRTTDQLARSYWFRHASNFESLPLERVSKTLEALVEERRDQRRADVLRPILAPGSKEHGLAELRRWVRAVTGRDDGTDLAVMAHFIWQVKRRSAGMPVSHDLMPIVTGLQGNGKTQAVTKLCGPLRELVRGVNVTDLTDDRSKAGLANFHIGIWDELAGGSKADQQALKHTISASSVSYRVLASHTIAVLPKRMTLIATSNDDVSDIITDTTGARRYYQLACNERCDWDTINAIDYPLLWQAVHLDDLPPFEAAADQIRLHQKTLIHVDVVAMWLQQETFELLEMVEADRVNQDHASDRVATETIPTLFPGAGEMCSHTLRRFNRWQRLHGGGPYTATKFGSRMKALGWTRSRDDVGARLYRYRPPATIPTEWALWGRFAPPRSPKTAEQRAATQAEAVAGFQGDLDDGPY